MKLVESREPGAAATSRWEVFSTPWLYSDATPLPEIKMKVSETCSLMSLLHNVCDMHSVQKLSKCKSVIRHSILKAKCMSNQLEFLKKVVGCPVSYDIEQATSIELPTTIKPQNNSRKRVILKLCWRSSLYLQCKF